MCAFVIGILLSSCANKNNAAPGNTADTPTPVIASAEAPTESNLPPEASPSPTATAVTTPESTPPPPTTAAAFTFEEQTYIKDTVTIKYPQITGMTDSAAQEKLNKLISDTALIDLKELEIGTEYELNYKVTFHNPAVISVYFEGYGNVPGAAHPYQFLHSVTIDVIKQKTVPLQALVTATEGFVDVMLNGKYSSMSYDMTDEYQSSIKDNLTSMGTDFWVGELRNADTPGYSTSSYLSQDSLVISVSVPHVMGDHVEISLTFKDLWGHQTDNLIWKEIEK